MRDERCETRDGGCEVRGMGCATRVWEEGSMFGRRGVREVGLMYAGCVSVGGRRRDVRSMDAGCGMRDASSGMRSARHPRARTTHRSCYFQHIFFEI